MVSMPLFKLYSKRKSRLRNLCQKYTVRIIKVAERERAKSVCVLRLSQAELNVAAGCRDAFGTGKQAVSPNYLAGPHSVTSGPLLSGTGALHQPRPWPAEED